MTWKIEYLRPQPLTHLLCFGRDASRSISSCIELTTVASLHPTRFYVSLPLHHLSGEVYTDLGSQSSRVNRASEANWDMAFGSFSSGSLKDPIEAETRRSELYFHRAAETSWALTDRYRQC
ncbi:hypothetical protein BJX68DRAFT_7371 [Aspergillus pseudodeflectus]|uniref:Uncharacterized protein n=1 Tax=Aspergillus pseudodeflectus TaxID=176178 RepID=A0ABR4LAH6_9EURO